MAYQAELIHAIYHICISIHESVVGLFFVFCFIFRGVLPVPVEDIQQPLLFARKQRLNFNSERDVLVKQSICSDEYIADAHDYCFTRRLGPCAAPDCVSQTYQRRSCPAPSASSTLDFVVQLSL